MKKDVQIRLLGTFETRDTDGDAIEFSHRKGRALLAYLAVERARSRSREQLATLLWARTGDERARHNLRQALSKVRSLCPGLIDSAGDRIALNSAACEIDLVIFEELARSDDIDDLQAALDLYRGDLLEGYSTSEADFQDWLLIERGRLRKLACEVAARLAALLEDTNREANAIAVLNRLLRLDPANESAHRELMVLLAGSGRRSDALRQYHECEAALRRELDAEPGAETRKLFADLKQNTAPRRIAGDTATVLYADMAGHDSLDKDAVRQTLRRYLELIASRITEQGGRIAPSKETAVLARFDTAADAVSSALTVQRQLGVMNAELEGPRRLRFRIGIGGGEVIEEQGNIRGQGLDVAKRLEALAEPGGICISDAVRLAIADRIAADFQFIGEHGGGNLADPVRAYRVGEASGGSRASGDDSSPALAAPGKPSLVVKPFVNMSADPEQDYFAEGLTKDISIALVKIPGLFLAMDESPAARLSRDMSVADLGHEFGVRYVLTGGVRRHGDRVRVNAELIEAKSGQCLWAERFDRELQDMFSIQDEITEEIATAMDVKLLRGEAARFLRKALTNPQALDLAYRGWHALYNGGSLQHVRDAQHFFEEVIRLEPDSPVGYASAAMAYWSEAGFGRVVVNSPAMERSAELAEKALERGDTTGFANMALALVHLARHEYEQAMVQATEGVTARPSCNGAYALKSSILNYLGRPREAIELAQYAVRLTPVYPAEFPAILAAAYHDSGRHAEAAAAARASLQLRPDDIDPLLILAAASAAQGNLEQARESAARVKALKPDFHLEEYAATQPYRDPQDLERLLGQLREAGLGD